jgi:hypothetical protein
MLTSAAACAFFAYSEIIGALPEQRLGILREVMITGKTIKPVSYGFYWFYDAI